MTIDVISMFDRQDDRKLVGCLIEDVRYGVDIMRVREIVNPGPLIKVPAIPDHVIGVSDHRQAIVPIIDLRRRFNYGELEVTRKTKWIIVTSESREIGIQVDRVTQVLKLKDATTRKRHHLLNDEKTAWIKDVYADQYGLIFELDLAEVIGPVTDLPETETEGKGEEQ